MANINLQQFIDDLRSEIFSGETATATEIDFNNGVIVVLTKNLDGGSGDPRQTLPGLTRGQKAAATREKNKKKAQRQALGSGINGGDANAKAPADVSVNSGAA